MTVMIAAPPSSSAGAAEKFTVIFTTPPNYASRLSNLFTQKGHKPIWCPTITTDITPCAVISLTRHLSPPSISLLSAIAFPSRTAISAASAAITVLQKPILPPSGDGDEGFVLAALGRDAAMIDRDFVSQFSSDEDRVRVIVPSIATPTGLVESLGSGRGRRILCPVPSVVELTEPPVVPRFLRDLEIAGWVPIRVDAYETRWVGPTCAEAMVAAVDDVDAVVFTSTAEVEGLLKGLREMGWDWTAVKRRRPQLVTAAHGPVTEAGAERLGVRIDVVNDKFGSFEGVVEALDTRMRDSAIDEL
ncbi:PREDICTED: uncharacterized protein LOC104827422 [Tarenaya hassleriana]|uniref:uncharacterized protein LOC104827422 n=1 Tax=Tarenaya hassleriana TaxID=28532 RepID=UPI00053C2FD0|nr:PREDICTED: uncharacterized protein LOC104827422 [Tarenaya hassleriana]